MTCTHKARKFASFLAFDTLTIEFTILATSHSIAASNIPVLLPRTMALCPWYAWSSASKAVARSKCYVSLGNAGPVLAAVRLLGRHHSLRSSWYLWHQKRGRACVDLLRHMVTRDGSGQHVLFAVLLVIALLHLTHSFLEDILRATSGTAASLPERARVIIWLRFDCSWVEQRPQDILENLGCLSLLPGKRARTAADATGRSHFLFPSISYHLTYTHSPSPVESSFTDSGAMVDKVLVSILTICVHLCVVPTQRQSKIIGTGVVLVVKSLLLQLRKLLWNYIGFEETCTQQNSSNFTLFRAVEHMHRHTMQPYTHTYSWHPSKRQSPLLHDGMILPCTTRYLDLIFPIILCETERKKSQSSWVACWRSWCSNA